MAGTCAADGGSVLREMNGNDGARAGFGADGISPRRRSAPVSADAWIAAPIATTSSGLMLPSTGLLKNSSTRWRTSGMRVEPPTSRIWSKSPGDRRATLMASRHTANVLSMIDAARFSSSARVMLKTSPSSLPPGPWATSGTSMLASGRLDSRIFSVSADARSRSNACGSVRAS